LRKEIFIIILLVSSTNTSLSQIRTSVSNLLRYGNGDQIVGNFNKELQYFENLTDVRINLPENLILGFRFLYDDPPEVGLPFQGISRRFIEYKKNNLSLRVGNSSQLYGRGMVLNLFENRGLAYDTWLDGIKASYRFGNLKASIVAGTIDFTDSISIIRTEEYNIRGGNIEYRFHSSTKLGFSFIIANAKIPQFNQSVANAKAELPELYLNFNHGPINIFLNWANQWTNSSDLNKSSRGHGIYSAISYATESFGITLDYKNYRFDLQDPFLRDDDTRTTKLMPFQNPPIVMKEHSYTLLSRSLHEVNFNDEVGFQIEADYSYNEDFSLNVNFSMASGHNSYVYNPTDFQFNESERNNNFLPSSEDKFSPFTEIFAEGEYYFSSTTAMRFGYANREKTIWGDITGSSGTHIVKSVVFPIQMQYSFSKNLSMLLDYEYEAVDDNFNSTQEKFYNQFISLIASIFRKGSVALRYEFTDNEFDLSGRKAWLLTEVGFRISGNDLVTLSYGRERGGQICSNGICRYILPFKGFRLTLQTAL